MLSCVRSSVLSSFLLAGLFPVISPILCPHVWHERIDVFRYPSSHQCSCPSGRLSYWLSGGWPDCCYPQAQQPHFGAQRQYVMCLFNFAWAHDYKVVPHEPDLWIPLLRKKSRALCSFVKESAPNSLDAIIYSYLLFLPPVLYCSSSCCSYC